MIIDYTHNPPFVIYKQSSNNDCGFACLKMLCRYHGLDENFDTSSYNHLFSSVGISLLTLTELAESLGFDCQAQQGSFNELLELSPPLPFIALWKGFHLVVVYDISDTFIKVADPSVGVLSLSFREFKHYWLQAESGEGIVLILNLTTH